MAAPAHTQQVLTTLLVHLRALTAAVEDYRHLLADRRPPHGTQQAYILALMGTTVLPVMPTDLVAFGAAQGVSLERRSLATALQMLKRQGAVESVGRGRWRRVGPPL